MLRRVLRKIETPSLRIAEIEYGAGLCLSRHSHDCAYFIYTIKGFHWSANGRGGGDCLPKTARFLPLGEPHENYFPTASKCFRVELPHRILDYAKEYDEVLVTPGPLDYASAVMLGDSLSREFVHDDDLSGLAIEDIALQLLQLNTRKLPSARGQCPVWLRRIREMLHDNKTARLTLAELASCAGRHPVQVCRQFHSLFGCTISRYVRQVRIAHAQSLLAGTELGIAEIALACGFSDQSHFTTAFRRISGITPGRYRLQFSKRKCRN